MQGVFFGVVVHTIYDCVDAFSKLLYTEYEIILGRKNQKVTLRVQFNKKDLYHLLGFQYLKDRPELNHDREKIFNALIRRKISAEHIESSHHYEKIKDRVNFLPYLEMIFDDNHTIFKYNEEFSNLSLIKANYLLENTIEERSIYTFLSKNDDDNYFCRSFFPKTNHDYTIGQTSWTLLYKKKIDKKAKTEIIVYNRL